MIEDALGIGRWKSIPSKIQRYINLDPNADEHKGKINIVSGVLGQGKTEIYTKLQSDNVIAINPRRSVLQDFCQRANQIDWTWYEKKPGATKPRAELIDASNLAICNLSLWKLQSTQPLKKYKHVIFDEFSLGISSSINKDAPEIKQSEEILRGLFETSETIWVNSWLFDDYCIDWLESIGKEIEWHKYHYPILENMNVGIWQNENAFLDRVAKLGDNGGVFIASELSDAITGLETKYIQGDDDWDYHNKTKTPTLEELKDWHNPKLKAGAKRSYFSPIVSHGADFRNEWKHTALHLKNSSKSIGGTDAVQFAMRNRDAVSIDIFATSRELDKKNLDLVKQNALKVETINEKQLQNIGTWNRDRCCKEIDQNDPIWKRIKWVDMTGAINREFREPIIMYQLKMLGLKDENITLNTNSSGEGAWKSTEEYYEQIIEGRLLTTEEYITTNDWQNKRYTEIARELGKDKIGMKDIKRYDGGAFKQNQLRQKKMYDPFIVRQAERKAKEGYRDRKIGDDVAYMIKKLITEDMTITQFEFKHTDIFIWLCNYENRMLFNDIMEFEQLSMLKITGDFKAKPLVWLEKYLTKHDFKLCTNKTRQNKDNGS